MALSVALSCSLLNAISHSKELLLILFFRAVAEACTVSPRVPSAVVIVDQLLACAIDLTPEVWHRACLPRSLPTRHKESASVVC